jgi:hypothetical protein
VVYRLDRFALYRQEIGLNKFRNFLQRIDSKETLTSPAKSDQGFVKLPSLADYSDLAAEVQPEDNPGTKHGRQELSQEERVVLDQLMRDGSSVRRRPVLKKYTTNLKAKEV